LRVPIAIRAFYESGLWILQTLLLKHPDLHPGLLDGGKYLLELCPLNAGGKPECPEQSAPVNYSWNATSPGLYQASDVRPGIYRLYLWDNNTGVPRHSREYADVLVADETRYQALSEDFSRVVEATRNWDADDSTAPALRRAYLYTLSQQ
jgi:hypothetical protein